MIRYKDVVRAFGSPAQLCDPAAPEGNFSVSGKINEEQLIRGMAVFTVEKFEKGGIMKGGIAL